MAKRKIVKNVHLKYFIRMRNFVLFIEKNIIFEKREKILNFVGELIFFSFF